MPSFDNVRECVVAALPGARKELSRLGLGGGSMALRSVLLSPVTANSSAIGAGEGLSSCEGLREKLGSSDRRFDIFEVGPASKGCTVLTLLSVVPICSNLFICSEGTSNIDVGRERRP